MRPGVDSIDYQTMKMHHMMPKTNMCGGGGWMGWGTSYGNKNHLVRIGGRESYNSSRKVNTDTLIPTKKRGRSKVSTDPPEK